MASVDYYLNHNLFYLFNEQVLATNQDQKFFSGNFISNENIEIFFNDPTFHWIRIYKDELSDIAMQIYTIKKYSLNFNKFLIIFYFYFWILEDLRMIANFINPSSKKILNIGAGIGLFDILLNNALKPSLHSLIEIKESTGQIGIDGTSNNFSEKIFPYDLLKKNLSDYKLKNIKINSPDALYLGDRVDFVISIRSWCFLYPVETYIEYLKKVATKKTLFIADLHRDYNDNFNNYFETKSVIAKLGIYNRLLFQFKQI